MSGGRQRSLDERIAEIETLLAELRREVAEQLQAATDRPRGRGGDIGTAAEQWVRGLGWDETFDEELVDEELGRLARLMHAELAPEQRARLLELWRTLRAERYPAAA
jgi:hypothetical protein